MVANFCSSTCLIFIARVDEFLSIVREFRDVVYFFDGIHRGGCSK